MIAKSEFIETMNAEAMVRHVKESFDNAVAKTINCEDPAKVIAGAIFTGIIAGFNLRGMFGLYPDTGPLSEFRDLARLIADEYSKEFSQRFVVAETMEATND